MTVPAKIPPQKAKANIVQWFDENAKDVGDLLPGAMSLQQYVGLCKAYLTEHPALLECTWTSLVKCFYLCARFGLIIGMQNRAHIVPYKIKGVKTGQLQIGYEGFIDLATGGELSHITAHVVYPADEFQYRFGTDPMITHIPSSKPHPEKMEDWVGVYSVAFWKDTSRNPTFHYMPIEDIIKIRDRSQAYRSAIKYNNLDTPWITNPDRMGMKSGVRAHSHYLPITSRFAAALKSQDELDTGTEQTSEVPGIDTEIEPTQTDKLEQELAPPAAEDNDASSPGGLTMIAREEAEMPTAPITAQEVIDYMTQHREIIGDALWGLYPEKNLRGFKPEALVEVYKQCQGRIKNATQDSGQTGLPLEGSES